MSTMKIILEHDCMNGEFRKGDELIIDPTMGLGDGDHIIFIYEDERVDIGRVVLSPQSEVPLVDSGSGHVLLSTEIEIAGKVTELKRSF